jgi:hypothetical protein
MRMVAQPLVNLPSAASIAFDDLLVDVATAYLRCLPGVGTLNARESLVSEGPPVETMLFHCDRNSIRFLKFFFYLNRVDPGGGPFTYVEGSHARKFAGWSSKHRWAHAEIVRLYGEQSIRYLTGDLGDVIVANTTGFHRGTKPEHARRLMFTVDYGIHAERGGSDGRFWMLEEDVAALPAERRPVADFLRRIPRAEVPDGWHAAATASAGA